MSTPSPFLSHLPAQALEACYRAAPGNEFETGKIFSPESSSALVANTFGLFLGVECRALPPLPGTELMGWPAADVRLEHSVRFPWSGGRHPWLDVFIETPTHIIGIESKRFEPFRKNGKKTFSQAYWRPVWGPRMTAYEATRDALHDGTLDQRTLDAVQLVKHAFGLVTEAARRSPGKQVALVYLHAEPLVWPDGKTISDEIRGAHASAVKDFQSRVAGDAVVFCSLTYEHLLGSWDQSGSHSLQAHVAALRGRFFATDRH